MLNHIWIVLAVLNYNLCNAELKFHVKFHIYFMTFISYFPCISWYVDVLSADEDKARDRESRSTGRSTPNRRTPRSSRETLALTNNGSNHNLGNIMHPAIHYSTKNLLPINVLNCLIGSEHITASERKVKSSSVFPSFDTKCKRWGPGISTTTWQQVLQQSHWHIQHDPMSQSHDTCIHVASFLGRSQSLKTRYAGVINRRQSFYCFWSFICFYYAPTECSGTYWVTNSVFSGDNCWPKSCGLGHLRWGQVRVCLKGQGRLVRGCRQFRAQVYLRGQGHRHLHHLSDATAPLLHPLIEDRLVRIPLTR